MTKKPPKPTINVVHSSYQPTRAELDKDLRVKASFKAAVQALVRPVEIDYTPQPVKRQKTAARR